MPHRDRVAGEQVREEVDAPHKRVVHFVDERHWQVRVAHRFDQAAWCDREVDAGDRRRHVVDHEGRRRRGLHGRENKRGAVVRAFRRA